MSSTAFTAPTTRGWLNGKRAAFLSLGVAAIAFIALTAGGIGDNLVYYLTPPDLQKAGDKAYGASIRLGGMVKEGSIVRHGASSVEFEVIDNTESVRVMTRGVPPQMFRENIGVVVEGTMNRSGYFDGDRLLVSHGNEYKAPDTDHAVNAEELIKSTEGLQ